VRVVRITARQPPREKKAPVACDGRFFPAGQTAPGYLANFDLLTDLPNRAIFHDRLSRALVQARRRGERVGVMFLDVDKFKLINDTLGHDMGDTLLRQVVRRLCDTVRPGDDTVGRLSGDEFGIILSGLRNAADAGLVAQKKCRRVQHAVSAWRTLAPGDRQHRHQPLSR